jgi:dTDP-glucose pyrophosphorylase
MNYKALLPCAGYGTRMNMLPTHSKELLPDPNTGKPLIEYHLDICAQHDITPLVITRADKQDLISYLNSNGVDYITITPEGEWPNTLLASYNHWDDKNFLLLPDTRFEGHNVIPLMKKNLELGAKTCFAVHEVADVSKWGQVVNYSVIEKPKDTNPGYAWGVAAFNKEEGQKWLEAMTIRNHPFQLENSSFVFLDKFVDITRTGVLEKY